MTSFVIHPLHPIHRTAIVVLQTDSEDKTPFVFAVNGVSDWPLRPNVASIAIDW